MTFSNITREPADDWIGTGIAETVTADLKKIEGLTVIGRARVFEALKNLSSGDLGSLTIGWRSRSAAAWARRGSWPAVTSASATWCASPPSSSTSARARSFAP